MLIDEGVPPDQVSATTWGIVVEVAGLAVRPVECHHWSSGTLSDGRQAVGNPIAFIVETEPGVRIYHYGDTCIFDMRLIGELYRPTVGLLGCTLPKELSHRIPGPATFLTGEMDADEAARTAEMLGRRPRRRLPLPRARRGGRAVPRARARVRHDRPPPGRRAARRRDARRRRRPPFDRGGPLHEARDVPRCRQDRRRRAPERRGRRRRLRRTCTR